MATSGDETVRVGKKSHKDWNPMIEAAMEKLRIEFTNMLEERVGGVAMTVDKIFDKLEGVQEWESRVDDLEKIVNEDMVNERVQTAVAREAQRRRDLADQVAELKEELAACRRDLARATSAGGVHVRKKKAPEPKPYDGARDGRVIDNFLWHMERYMEALDIVEEDEKEQTATMYLTDTAALWWRRLYTNRARGERGVRTWEEFKRELKRQFYPESVEDLAMIKLRRLQQKGSIREYVKEYSSLMLEVPDMPERQRLCFFIDGLQSWVATELRRREPRDLESAMAIAERLEDFRKDERPVSPRRDRAYGKGDRKHKASSPKVTDDERSGDEGRHRKGKGKDIERTSKPRDRPAKHGDASFRGCYLCGGDHIMRNCPQRKTLHAMVKKTRETSDSEGEQQMGALQLLGTMVERKAKDEAAKTGKKARSKGLRYANVEIGGKVVQALVDSGATHNFMAPDIAEKLGLKPTKDEGWVKAVNSEERQTHGIAKGVELRMGSWRGNADFTVIDMDDHKVVLGVDFMEKCNAAPIPYLGVLMMMGGDGQASCMVPLVQHGEGTSKALGAIEFTRGSKLKPGERLVGPRTYAEVVKRCRAQQEAQGQRS